MKDGRAHWKILFVLLTVVVLTVLTQVGGIVFLISLASHKLIDKKIKQGFAKVSAKLFSFLFLYLIASFVIVPLVARPFGRIPLPIIETNHLKPLTFWTCLLNRNYVRPELREAAFNAANKMNEKYKGTEVSSLPALES